MFVSPFLYVVNSFTADLFVVILKLARAAIADIKNPPRDLFMLFLLSVM